MQRAHIQSASTALDGDAATPLSDEMIDALRRHAVDALEAALTVANEPEPAGEWTMMVRHEADLAEDTLAIIDEAEALAA